MENVLIAYNDDGTVNLHSFFEDCADLAKQWCFDNNHSYSSVDGANLSADNVCQVMDKYSICFIAAHGDPNGIYNSSEEGVVSTRTTNNDFSGKLLYAVSCLCGQNLLPHLKSIGLKTFVGYNDSFYVIENEPFFIESAMSGLKSLLAGDNETIAKQKMLDSYNESIARATTRDAKKLLLHNREHLCFE